MAAGPPVAAMQSMSMVRLDGASCHRSMRTVVQAVIFLTLGAGGLWINNQRALRTTQASA